jgi:hypothetical protein
MTFSYYREQYEQRTSKHSKTSQKKMKIIISMCRTLLAACSLFLLHTIKFKEKGITTYKPIFFIVVLHPGKCDLSWIRDVITVRDSLTRFQFLLTSGTAITSSDSIANKLVYRSSCIELNLSSSDQLTGRILSSE